jgi:hypothetical protein
MSRQSSFEDFASTPGEKAVAEAIAADNGDPEPDDGDGGNGDGGGGGDGDGDGGPIEPPERWHRAVEYVREFYDDSYDARTKLGADLKRWAAYTDVDAPRELASETVLQPLIRYQKLEPMDVWDAITQAVAPADARTIGAVIVDFAVEHRARDDDRTLTLREEAQVRSHAENGRLDQVLSVILNDKRAEQQVAELLDHPRELVAYRYGTGGASTGTSFEELPGVGQTGARRLQAALPVLVGVFGRPGQSGWAGSERQMNEQLDAAASGRRRVPIIVVPTTASPSYYVIEEDDPNAGGALVMGAQDDLDRILRDVIGPASQFEPDARIGTATVEWARQPADRELVDVDLASDIIVEELPGGVANAQESWFEAARRSASQRDTLGDLLRSMGGMAQLTGAMPSWVDDIRGTIDELGGLYEPGVQSFGTVETPDDFDCATREQFAAVAAYALYRLNVDPEGDDADTQYRDRLADQAAATFERLGGSLFDARCDVAIAPQAYDATVQDLVLALRYGDVDHRPPAGWLVHQLGDSVSPAKGRDYEPGAQQAAAPSSADVEDVADALGDGWVLAGQSADRLRLENDGSDLPADAVTVTRGQSGWVATYERGSQEYDGTDRAYDRPAQAADAVASFLAKRRRERSVDRAYASLSGSPETAIPTQVGQFTLVNYGWEAWTYAGRFYGTDGVTMEPTGDTHRTEMRIGRADPSDDFADESRPWNVTVPSIAREFDDRRFDRLDEALAYLREVADALAGKMEAPRPDAKQTAEAVAIEGVIDRLDGGLPDRANGWAWKDASLFGSSDHVHYVGGEWEPQYNAKRDRLRHVLSVGTSGTARDWHIKHETVNADNYGDWASSGLLNPAFDSPEAAVSALLALLDALPPKDGEYDRGVLEDTLAEVRDDGAGGGGR